MCIRDRRGHGLNASGYGSWPYILAIDFNDDNIFEYGSNAVNVEYGNTDDSTAIDLANRNPGDRAEVHLTITDPALNFDPTTADVWSFDLSDNDGNVNTVTWDNNGTNNALDAEELGQMGCVDNCALYSDGEAVLIKGAAASLDVISMTETGPNTGVFESFDANGQAEFETIAEAAGDTKTVFTYGDNTVDMIITYSDATISFDAGGDWSPGQSATVTVNDWEANKNPTSVETLSVGDETVKIPTIVMGTGGLNITEGTAGASTAGQHTPAAPCILVCIGDDDSGACLLYTSPSPRD